MTIQNLGNRIVSTLANITLLAGLALGTVACDIDDGDGDGEVLRLSLEEIADIDPTLLPADVTFEGDAMSDAATELAAPEQAQATVSLESCLMKFCLTYDELVLYSGQCQQNTPYYSSLYEGACIVTEDAVTLFTECSGHLYEGQFCELIGM